MRCDPLDNLRTDVAPLGKERPRQRAADKAVGNGRQQSLFSGLAAKNLFSLILSIGLAFTFVPVLPAWGEEPPAAAPAREPEVPQGPLDYDLAVRLAIRQSPFFTKSLLEIDIKRLDETDSKYDMIPNFAFQTLYYIDKPQQSGMNKNSFSLRFISENYNPMLAYFTLQARKLFTQMAIYSHMGAIEEGLQRLGKLFLEMDSLKKVAARQQEFVELARQNLTYVQNRLQIGTGTSLELKVATQELEAARMEMERIAYTQKRLQGNMKALIGSKSEQEPTMNLKEAYQQIVGRYDPAAASLEQAKIHSFELKKLEIKKELQKYQIVVAKTKLLPNLLFGAINAEPLSLIRSRDMFFYVGVNVPVWDGFKRFRNISRQKAILKDYANDQNLKALELDDKWNEAQDNWRSAAVAKKAAQAQEELARLRERQAEIRYQSGGEPLPIHLEGRKGLLEAQKNAILKTLDYDLAVLGLRYLSGDLGATYVDARSWQQ